jgi:hypothetical protein
MLFVKLQVTVSPLNPSLVTITAVQGVCAKPVKICGAVGQVTVTVDVAGLTVCDIEPELLWKLPAASVKPAFTVCDGLAFRLERV